jgi:hypothetical protein
LPDKSRLGKGPRAQCRGNFAAAREPFAGIDFFAQNRIENVIEIGSKRLPQAVKRAHSLVSGSQSRTSHQAHPEGP